MSGSRRAGTLAATALAVVVSSTLIASPAIAAPWDGNDVEFGPGDWDLSGSLFVIDDVYLVFPDTSTTYTDIWDGAGETAITAAGAGLSNEFVECIPESDVDVETEAGTGDLVITCDATNANFATAMLDVVSEIRILAGGEVIRFLTTITNSSGADVVIDAVTVETDFGTTDFLYDYDNQSDGILAVPAAEVSANFAALNTAEALWIVHWNDRDAPGGLVMGTADALAPGAWLDSGSSDEYMFGFGPFTIPDGESRSVVTFATWDPQTLIDGDYEQINGQDALLNSSADQIVAGMADFDALDGLLASGIDDLSTVVNWDLAEVPAPEEPEPEPELAETGAADVAGLALGGLVLLAVGFVVASRRRIRA